MKKINLRDYYPFCDHDMFVDIPSEIAAVLLEAERQEEAYRRRVYRNKAQYSLDRDDGIEHDINLIPLSPYEVYERKVTIDQVYAAINTLPAKQGKRIFAHYMLGLTKSEMARIEGISEKNIRKSISQGLRNMALFLKHFSE